MSMTSSLDERLRAEIREVNLSYLILAQNLIRQDRAQARFRLGISEAVAQLVEALSPAQIARIAQGTQLLCRLSCDDSLMWSLLADAGLRDAQGQDRSAARLHAAILMSGPSEEVEPAGTVPQSAPATGRRP